MPNRQIYSYTESSGEEPVTAFIQSLQPKLQAKIDAQIRQLAEPSCPLQPPNVKAFRTDRYKGFYELRTRIRQMVRIIFYIDSDDRIILLHGFIKQHDRATKQALETARARKLALALGDARLKSIF